MLENISQEVIIPSYAAVQEDMMSVDEALDAFEGARTEGNLSMLRERVLEAYISWQACSVFEFGPAAENNLRLVMNTFPVDTGQIGLNLTDDVTYDLNSAVNADAQGLPALDYLLFAVSNASVALSDFEGADNPRMVYMHDCVDRMLDAVDATVSGWDVYAVEFKSNTASDVGSPIGLLVNQINYEFELLKNARVGIPLGKKTLGVTQPEKVEAVYASHSFELAIANLNGIEAAFDGGAGSGLDDYLNALDARGTEGLLSEQILLGFTLIREEFESFDVSMQEAIENEPVDLESAYTAIEQTVVLLKTDMPSQLGVQITYQDNDGD